MNKKIANSLCEVIKFLGHSEECTSKKVIRVERSGDTNDCDVFGECDCGIKTMKRFMRQQYPEVDLPKVTLVDVTNTWKACVAKWQKDPDHPSIPTSFVELGALIDNIEKEGRRI